MNRSGRMVLLALLACMPGTRVSSQAQSASQAEANAQTQPKAPTTAAVKPSQAERALRLEQAIESGTKELAELKARLTSPESEYTQAKDNFARLEKRLKDREKELTTQPAPAAGEDPLAGLKKARELAKERFELAVKEAGSIREKTAAVELKLQLDHDALAKLKGLSAATSQPAATATPTGPNIVTQAPPTAGSSATGRPAAPGPVAPATPAPAPGTPAAPEAAPPAAPTVKMPGLVGLVTAPPATLPKPDSTAPASDVDSKELVEAQAKAHDTQAQAATAEQELALMESRIANLRQAIKAETQLRDSARQRSANANATYASRRDYIQKLISTGTPTEELNKVWARVDEAEKLAAAAQAEVNRRQTNLDDLNAQVDDLRAEQEEARRRAEQAQAALNEVKSQVQRLENPFSVYNIKLWLLVHGPRVVGILLGIGLLLWLTGKLESRIIKLISRGEEAGRAREREARARTLASVFRNFGSIVIVCGGILMVLTEVRINIVPLLGGAAVFGLAVAFGAQSLIKDYFYGFMILLENQYAINDVVKIGDVTGAVERITLRMTLLRDEDGSAHFIPHGEIKKVTNLTHGWSRAVFEIGVGYRENVDEVMRVIVELGQKIRQDPMFRRHILEDLEMLGVNALGDSAVLIKFNIKTRPLQQWAIKREMLRRIKMRFDELGIEIPYPHRTIHLRQDADGPGTGGTTGSADVQS